MTKALDLGKLLNSSGDVPAEGIADGAVTPSKLTARVKQVRTGGKAYGTISNGSSGDLRTVQLHSNPFPSDSGLLLITARSLIKLTTRGSTSSDAHYYKMFKNCNITSGQTTGTVTGTDIGSNVNDTNMGFRIGNDNFFSDAWTNLTFSIFVPHTAGDTYTLLAFTDNANCTWVTNELNVDFVLFTGITVV